MKGKKLRKKGEGKGIKEDKEYMMMGLRVVRRKGRKMRQQGEGKGENYN